MKVGFSFGMLRFRPFRNFDPPALARIWAEQSRFGLPCLEITPGILERHVLGKLFFCPQGLIVALQGSEPVGFAHAGFGPGDSGIGLDTSMGVICAVAMTPVELQAAAAEGLVRSCEEYLRRSGAREIFVGGAPFIEPFWVGICPGGRLPGIPENYPLIHDVLKDLGYSPLQQRKVFGLNLAQYSSPLRPEFLRIQIAHTVSSGGEADLPSWWELATLASFQLETFELRERRAGRPVAWVRLLYHDSPGARAVPRCVSIWEVSRTVPNIGQEWEAFLIAQVASELARRGVESIAFQCQVPLPGETAVASPLSEWLRFVPCHAGIVYFKKSF